MFEVLETNRFLYQHIGWFSLTSGGPAEQIDSMQRL